MSLVLVVDDDVGTLEGFEGILRYAGFQVATAESGQQALILLRRLSPDVVLADLRLPDISGLEFLCKVRRDYGSIPFVIVTGFGSSASAVEAMRLGATDYVEKPVIDDDLIQIVERALAGASQIRGPALPEPEDHGASRWAQAMLPVVNSRTDSKTLKAWSRCSGISQGTLKTWCRAIGVSPKRSLSFARLLRAILQRDRHGYAPEESLDIVDQRTLAALLKLGGVSSGNAKDLSPNIDVFIQQQSLVRNPHALRELRQKLRGDTC